MRSHSSRTLPIPKQSKPQKQPYQSIKQQKYKNSQIKNKFHQQNIIYKQNQDLDWLQKVVHGFQWYKDKKNHLFYYQYTNDRYPSNQSIQFSLNNTPKTQSHQLPSHQKKPLHQITKKLAYTNNKPPKDQNPPKPTKNTIKVKRLQNQHHHTQQKKLPRSTKQKQTHKSSLTQLLSHKQLPLYDHPTQQLPTNKQNSCTQTNRLKPSPFLFQHSTKHNHLKKITNIKINHQNFNDFITQIKRTSGKIIKNKSLQYKPNKNISSFPSINNNTIDKNYQEINISKITINIKQLQQQLKHKNHQPNTQQCFIQQFNPKLPKTNNKQSQLQQKPCDLPLTHSPTQIFQQCTTETNKKQLTQVKQTIHQQLQFQKYQQYIESFQQNSKQIQQQASRMKKQRKLNASFGQRKIQPYNEVPNLMSTANFAKRPQCQGQTDQKISCSFLIENIVSISSSREQDNADYPANRDAQNSKISQIEQQSGKYAQSGKCSSIATQHSTVLEKPQPTEHLKDQNQTQQWNILDIFTKLDGKRQGILSSTNCTIQNTTCQIRYILGSVLQQILYKNLQLTFNDFLIRVQKCLQSLKYLHPKNSPSHISNPSQSLKTTPKIQKNFYKKQHYHHSFQPNLIKHSNYVQILSNKYSQKYDKSPHKKYDYSKNFIQQNPFNKNNKLVPTIYTLPQQQADLSSDNLTLGSINNNQISFEQIIQKKHQPNDFLTPTKINQTSRIINQEPLNKLKNQNFRQNYQNQISKLEMLNNRLETYLNNQNLKDLSAGKLLLEEI